MHERGYQLGNVDITIIAQQPKLSPHKEKMRDQLCLLLGSHPSTVNIKASAHVLLWLLAALQNFNINRDRNVLMHRKHITILGNALC
jgi:2-C-methyl-D-erythritol 2,4-cyclodiphosphate synthase